MAPSPLPRPTNIDDATRARVALDHQRNLEEQERRGRPKFDYYRARGRELAHELGRLKSPESFITVGGAAEVTLVGVEAGIAAASYLAGVGVAGGRELVRAIKSRDRDLPSDPLGPVLSDMDTLEYAPAKPNRDALAADIEPD